MVHTGFDMPEVLESHPFPLIAEVAGRVGTPAYVVGGFVRDVFLRRPSKDIDVVAVGEGSGIALAQAVAQRLGGRLSVFRNFGTAQVKARGVEIEFVGARRESYSRDSRKPVVEDGSLEDDLGRRDFTINAMAVSLNAEDYGELLDPFDGMADMEKLVLRTPKDADVTFDDDPLRMLRAVRFASQLGFFIHPDTFDAIVRNVHRLEILSPERIQDELNKIVLSPRPSIGFDLLDRTGLLDIVLPELSALKGVETRVGIGHKDNFAHTLLVLDKVARVSDNLWLRWAALLHDIAKPLVKRWDARLGWTFHSHEFQGQRVAAEIFRRLRLPLDGKLRYVQKLIGLHMRPVNLSDEEITDSALRRLLFDAGEELEDLFVLCEADVTSKNPVRARRFLENYRTVRRKISLIEEADRIRNFRPAVSGSEIMELFGLPPSPPVGRLKTALKDAILDGKVPNEREAAQEFLRGVAREMGLEEVQGGWKRE
jgi:tRNA nucleotidyltransferase/poly(A) polymerase